MQYKSIQHGLIIVAIFALLVPTVSSAADPPIGVTSGITSSLGESSKTMGRELTLEPNNPSAGLLTREDYTQIYFEAKRRRDNAVHFRLCQLQLQTDQTNITCPSDLSLEKYYADFNNQALQNSFCSNSQLNEHGYCSDNDDIRNQLLKARNFFIQMYLVEPQNLTIKIGNQELVVKEEGLKGLLETTRELAFAHMIFASEYAIDAFDYRFTIEGLAGGECNQTIMKYQEQLKKSNSEKDSSYNYFADADCIIRNEIALLEEAKKHYGYVIRLLDDSFETDSAWPLGLHIGNLFTADEIDVFLRAMENYAIVVDEHAIRERQLGNDLTAHDLYTNTYTLLSRSSKPLIEKAAEISATANITIQTSLYTGGLAYRTSLEKLQARIQEIDNGVNVFGYTPDYVPVQSYIHMKEAADTLLNWAEQTNNDAINATRTFETNANLMNQEIQSVQRDYASRLFDICGNLANDVDYDDTYQDCEGYEGSLMDRSWIDLATAYLHIVMAEQQVTNTLQAITDTIEEAGQMIYVKTATSQKVQLNILAQGMARAYQVTQATSQATTDDVFRENTKTKQTIISPGLFGTASEGVTQGVNAARLIAVTGATYIPGGQFASGVIGTVGPAFESFFGSTHRLTNISHTEGKRHSETTTSSMSSIYNPSEITIANIETLNEMLRLSQEISTTIIARDYQVKALLRQLAEQQINKQIYVEQYNQAAAEHNTLVAQYRYWRSMYLRARNNLGLSYIANPAYRLLREHKTEVANAQLEQAAHQAYLTAKALEYEMLDDVPFISDVFKVRQVTHLHAYLQKVESLFRIKKPDDEYERVISLKELVSGITQAELDRLEGDAYTKTEREQDELFHEYLEKHLVITNNRPMKLNLVFSTSLLAAPFNDAGIYNWRIAGAVTGSTSDVDIKRCPSRKEYGVSVILDQGPQILPPGMTVILIQSGHTIYRKRDGSLVEYSPQMITLLPREDIPTSIRESLGSSKVSATIEVNSSNTNTISDFCNRSVAASDWILEVDLEKNRLDWEKLLDIRIKLRTFGYSR